MQLFFSIPVLQCPLLANSVHRVIDNLLTLYRVSHSKVNKCNSALVRAKIEQTKMLVTCQRFGDLFLFGLVWQHSENQNQYNKGRFKVMAT